MKNTFKSATIRLNQLLDQDSSFAAQIANARKKVQEFQEKQTTLEAKSASFRATLDSNQAVKFLLASKRSGVYGTVAELGQVKKKYALPLERAAGAKMQNLVVDTDKTAAECIKVLQKERLGSASFIPLNKIKYHDVTAEDKKLLKQEGAHDFAINLISFSPEYKKAFSYVFGSTLVVEDMDVARKIGINSIKMASLDGSIAEASGVMKGGFFKKSGVGFQEEDSLEELKMVEKGLAESQNVVAAVMDKRDANEQEISSLRHKKAELEAEVIKLEKSLHLDTGDLDASKEADKQLRENAKGVEDKLMDI